MDDLFLYSLSPKLTATFAETAHLQTIPTPRTYGVFINSRNLSELKQRRYLAQKIDPKRLTGHCYSDSVFSTSLVPNGYLGYTLKEHSDPPITSTNLPKLNVQVLDIIYQKECVEQYLKEALKNLDARIEIVSLEAFMENWQRSSVDLWVGYIDAENSDTFFGDFSPKSRLKLGDAKDADFDHIYEKYILEQKKPAKVKMASDLADRILSKYTILPLFHPSATMLYQNRIKKFDAPLKSPCFIPTEYLELSGAE